MFLGYTGKHGVAVKVRRCVAGKVRFTSITPILQQVSILLWSWGGNWSKHTIKHMCSSGRLLPALMVNTYQQSEHQKGHMEAMDPTSSERGALGARGGAYLHYNARRSSWRRLLVWYSDVRGEAREGGGLSSAPARTSFFRSGCYAAPGPFSSPPPPLACILLCLISLLQIFCLGKNQ